jgi:hypothetical protein
MKNQALVMLVVPCVNVDAPRLPDLLVILLPKWQQTYLNYFFSKSKMTII